MVGDRWLPSIPTSVWLSVLLCEWTKNGMSFHSSSEKKTSQNLVHIPNSFVKFKEPGLKYVQYPLTGGIAQRHPPPTLPLPFAKATLSLRIVDLVKGRGTSWEAWAP